MSAPRLPLAAQDLWPTLAGRRIERVRRAVATDADPDSPRLLGPAELRLDDGRTLSLLPDGERHSLSISDAPLDPAPGEQLVDVTRSEFWRWRRMRPIRGIWVWKSLDVSEKAEELEFGLELAFEVVPAAAFEYLTSEDDVRHTLVITDGALREPCRRLAVL